KLNNIRIGTRLIYLITILIVASIFIGGIGFINLGKLNSANNSLYKDNLLAVSNITSFKSNLIENQSLIRAMIISTDMDEVQSYHDKVQKNDNENDTLLYAYKKTKTKSEDKEHESKIEQDIHTYQSISIIRSVL